MAPTLLSRELNSRQQQVEDLLADRPSYGGSTYALGRVMRGPVSAARIPHFQSSSASQHDDHHPPGSGGGRDAQSRGDQDPRV